MRQNDGGTVVGYLDGIIMWHLKEHSSLSFILYEVVSIYYNYQLHVNITNGILGFMIETDGLLDASRSHL